MINTSQTYKQLFNERAIQDYRLLVDGIAYTNEDIKDSIVLQQNLFDKSTFTVGSFTIGVLKLKLTVPSDEIPHNASVVFSYRYNNGETQSEWIDKFKGNITKRTIHGDALTEIEVKDRASNYDKFLDYFGESLSKYPANTREVANLCASHLGLEIDNIEDVINLDIVEYPNENTIVEMLKEVATNSGGNWVIVGDKLRLVTTGNKLGLSYPARSIKENALLSPISKVLIYYANLTAFESGTDIGSTLEADSKWGTQESADYVHSILNGYEYRPLKVTGAYADPALELGDIILIDNEEVLMANVKWEFDGSVIVDIEVPITGEINYDDPYNKMMQSQFDRKVTLGDSYQGVTISRNKGIQMLVSPDGSEENATGRYYADLYRGIAFQTRNDIEENWHDWLYFDMEEQKFKLLLDGDRGDINQHIILLETDLDGISAQVQNIHSGNIIPNLNGELGYVGWQGAGSELVFTNDLIFAEGMKFNNAFVPKRMEGSLSDWGISFYGKNRSPLGRVIPDTHYSWRGRAMKFLPFDITVIEYAEDETIIKNTVYNFTNPSTYLQFTHDPDNGTRYIALEFNSPTATYTNRLELSEMMFNRGEPKEWFENVDGIKTWAEAMFEIQGDRIDLTVQDLNGLEGQVETNKSNITQLSNEIELKVDSNNVIAAINLSSDKIKGGRVDITGTTSFNDNVVIQTDGTIKAVKGEFRDALITGNLTAGKIAGLIFDGNKITFPDGKLVLDSVKNAITFGRMEMSHSSRNVDGYTTDLINIKTPTGSIQFISGLNYPGGNLPNVLMAESVATSVISSNTGRSNIVIGGLEGVVPTQFTGETIFNAQLRPSGSSVNVGTSSNRFNNIYLRNQPNVSSDIRQKHSIQDIPKGLIDEIVKVEPKMYLQHKTWHFGYIAQDIERALYKWATREFGRDAKYYVDKFAFLHKDESYLSLLYGEIAVLKERAMSDRISKLEEELQAIKELLKERND